MRPKKLSDVLGQEGIIGDGKILTEIVKKGEPVNLIFWGPPGTGKTTFVRMLSGNKKFVPDNTSFEIPEMSISYKPQTIAPKYPGTVHELLQDKLGDIINHQSFLSEVVKPMKVDLLYDNEVQKLSG